ncbi:DNA adenine methylase [Bavariicoccus seileri]|uniref:DNA adenine methylase n=1 Tax=Bavariicoccus seileri TaxID=549685 RepID=UPI0003B410E6|nr:DNA adenine methylase [Bavariicoccus seileri]
MPVTHSPLRYPGGKTQLCNFVKDTIELNNITDTVYCEPYAGGCGVGLKLLLTGSVNEIVINDYDPAIFNFWRAILEDTDEFIDLINQTDITIKDWHRQKEIYELHGKTIGSLEGAFATFFLNRTNVSGIISGGPIGGKSQQGKYKLDCRFNKKTSINKIKEISHYRDQITLFNVDACELVDILKSNYDQNNLFIFFDPPYYEQGKSLYLSFYNHKQHIEVRDKILSLEDWYWILTYDKTAQISDLYSGADQAYEYNLTYSANKKRVAQEYIFASPILNLQSSDKVELTKV